MERDGEGEGGRKKKKERMERGRKLTSRNKFKRIFSYH